MTTAQVVAGVRALTSGRHPVLALAINIAGGIAAYYVLRLIGLSAFAALVVVTAVSVMTGVWSIVRSRRVDGLVVFFMVMLLLSLCVSLVGGGTRFLLAKEGWIIGAGGVCFLVSIRAGRPLAFQFARPMLEGRFGIAGQSWDRLWEHEAKFRRIWRVSTCFWGVGGCLDGAARVLIAYRVPIDVVPVVGAVQYVVFMVIMQPLTGIYYWRAGLWRLLRAEREATRGPGDAPGPLVRMLLRSAR